MEKNNNGRSYCDLVAWQKAMDLVELMYAATRNWPKEELYGLTGQIRRAVVSIPSNIAEGQGRISTKEFLRYLSIACGSVLEVETQLVIAHRPGYSPVDDTEALLACTAEVESSHQWTFPLPLIHQQLATRGG